MNACEARNELRAGLVNLGIKEKEIWNKEGNESFEEPEFKDIKINVVTHTAGDKSQYGIIFTKDDREFEVELKSLIKAAYDNTSYGGMVGLERMK